jgi:pimeloyl-ACP methyl ester carboxylesterase
MRFLSFAFCGVLAFTPTVSAQDNPSYGPQLEGFDYPHELKRRDFTSQRQNLSMGYMDIAPETANGRTAVLLHGKNFCAATWDATITELTKAGFRVIAPDQIGFCTSSKPTGYQFSFHQLAANTKELLDQLGVKQAVVIGHSMGGMLAARYTLMYPELVEQLVLVNPIGLEDWQAKGVPYAKVDVGFEGEKKTTAETIKNYQLKFYYDGKWKPEYDRWVDMAAGLYSGSGGEIVAWNQALTSDMVFTQPVVHEFPRIKTKTLLIIGGKDRTAPGANRARAELRDSLGNYPELGKRTAKAIPNAELVELPDLGHSPQVEAPAEFHAALLKGIAAK